MASRPKSASAPQVQASTFTFSAGQGRIFRAAAIGATGVPLFASWGFFTGRVKGADPTYWAVVFGGAIAAGILVGWRLLTVTQKAALALGVIIVDEKGLRWQRRDKSIVFDSAWSDFQGGIVDRTNDQILLKRHKQNPVLLSRVMGNIDMDGFAKLAALVESKLTLEPHGKVIDRVSARRVIFCGTITCLVAAALFGLNTLVGAQMGWSRMMMPMPVVVAATGTLILFAGVRISLGKGPIVSMMYNPSYGRTVLRFLLVASMANVVLVWVMNGVK